MRCKFIENLKNAEANTAVWGLSEMRFAPLLALNSLIFASHASATTYGTIEKAMYYSNIFVMAAGTPNQPQIWTTTSTTNTILDTSLMLENGGSTVRSSATPGYGASSTSSSARLVVQDSQTDIGDVRYPSSIVGFTSPFASSTSTQVDYISFLQSNEQPISVTALIKVNNNIKSGTANAPAGYWIDRGLKINIRRTNYEVGVNVLDVRNISRRDNGVDRDFVGSENGPFILGELEDQYEITFRIDRPRDYYSIQFRTKCAVQLFYYDADTLSDAMCENFGYEWGGITSISTFDGTEQSTSGVRSSSGFQYAESFTTQYLGQPVGVLFGVPEPSQWALFIIGFGLVGGVSRYRRSYIHRFLAV